MSTTSTASRPTTTPNTGIAQPAAAGLSSTFGVQSAKGRNEKPSDGTFPSGSAGGPSTTVADSTYVGYDNGQWTQAANPSPFATVPSHPDLSTIADSPYPTGGAFSTASYNNGQWTTGPASTLLPATQATSVTTGALLPAATTTVTTLPPGAVIPSAANSHMTSCMLLLPLFVISMRLLQAN